MMFEEPKDLFEEQAPANLPVGGAPKSLKADLKASAEVSSGREEASKGRALGPHQARRLGWIVAAVLLVVGVSGFLAWLLMFRKGPSPIIAVPSPESLQDVLDVEASGADAETESGLETVEFSAARLDGAAASLDRDGDGLSDEEENRNGTDPDAVDTDEDGLGDREEVNVYKTDPTDADTDEDGFTDGTEVRNGYNPKGSGKLLQVPLE